jgi:hypothetical protein
MSRLLNLIYHYLVSNSKLLVVEVKDLASRTTREVEAMLEVASEENNSEER